MKILRQILFARIVSLFCLFFFVFHSTIVVAQPLIRFDYDSKRIHCSTHEGEVFTDIDADALIQRLEGEMQSEEGWSFCNHGKLDVSFQMLKRLTGLVNVVNNGNMSCFIGDKSGISTDAYALDALSNSGSITFVDQRTSTVPDQTSSTHSISLTFQTLLNQGQIQFRSLLPLEWNVAIDFAFQNLGTLTSPNQFYMTNRSKMRTLSVGGIICVNGLTLSGFDHICAYISSGFVEEPSDPGSEKLGYLRVASHADDTSSEFMQYMTNYDSTDANAVDFLWEGQVNTSGLTTLQLVRSSGKSIKAKVTPTFNTHGLNVSCQSDEASHIRLGKLDPNPSDTDEKSFSDVKEGGLHVGFSSAQGQTTTGNISIQGIYSVLGLLSLEDAECVSVLQGAEVLFHKDMHVGAHALSIDGILSRAKDIAEQSFNTDAIITVGKTGQLFLPRFSNNEDEQTKRNQRIINHGYIDIEQLIQRASLKVVNNGAFQVQKGSKRLHVENNTGTVTCPMPILETFSEAYFEPYRRLDGSGYDPIPVQGALKTLSAVSVDLSAAQEKLLLWSQSIFASSLLFDNLINKGDHPTAEIKVEPDTVLSVSHNRIKIRAQKVYTTRGSRLFARQYVHLDTPLTQTKSRVIHEGLIDTPTLIVSGTKIKGNGTLNSKTLLVKESGHIDINHFQFGEDLENIDITSHGMFSFVQSRKQNREYLSIGTMRVNAPHISIHTHIHALGLVRLLAKKDSASKLHINADIVSKGLVFAQSPLITFADNHKITIRGKDIALHTESASAFNVPQNVTLKANKKGIQSDGKMQLPGFLSLRSLGTLDVYGKLSAEEASLFGERGVLINGKALNRNHLLSIAGGTFHSDAPIEAKRSFSARVKSLTLKGLEAAHFDIEATDFAQIDETLSCEEPSILRTHQLIAHDMTMKGSITLAGYGKDSLHHLHNIRGKADITQENSSLVFTGDNATGAVHAHKVLSVPKGSALHAKQLDQYEHLDAYYLNGNVYLGQSTVALSADQVIAYNFHRSGAGNTFESVVLAGKNIEIGGNLSAQSGRIEAHETLRLKQAELMGHVFYLLSKGKVKTEDSSVKAAEARIEAPSVQLHDSKLQGGSHVIHTDGHLDAKGSSTEVKHLTIQAQTATLLTSDMHAETAYIKLSDYGNGISGAIKLAHDLVHCEHVHLDAKKEFLSITRPTSMRPNVAFSLAGVDVQAPLKSKGDLSLESEDGIRVTSGIYAHNVNLLANHGDIHFYRALLDAVEDLSIQALDGSVSATLGKYTAGRDLTVDASKDATAESIVTRHGNGSAYYDTIERIEFEAGRTIHMKAGGTLHFMAVKTKSGGDTRLNATTFINESKPLESHYEFHGARESIVQHSVTNARSIHDVGGSYPVATHGDQHHQAPIIHAKEKIQLTAGGKINIYAVTDSHYYEHHSRTKRKVEHVTSSNTTSVGGIFRAQVLEGVAIDEINIICSLFDTKETYLKSDRLIRIMLGQKSSSYSRTMSYKGAAWNRMKMHQEQHQEYVPTQFTGSLRTEAPTLELQQVSGKPLDFLQRHSHVGGDIHYEYVQEVHNIIRTRLHGPNAAVTAVIGSAIAIATAGSGTPAVTVLSAMSQAALATLYTHATVALLSNDMNVNKAARSLNSDTIKSMAISAGSAGITQGVSSYFNINTTPGTFTQLPEYAKYYGLQGAVNIASRVAQGSNLQDAFVGGLKSTAISMARTLVANEVSDLFHDNPILDVTAQTTTATGLGYAIYGDRDAAFASGIGAFIGSASNHILPDNRPTQSSTDKDLHQEHSTENRAFNTRLAQLPHMMAIIASMAFGLEDHYHHAEQAAGMSYDAGRGVQEREFKRKHAAAQKALEEKLLKDKIAREQAEAERIRQEQLRVEANEAEAIEQQRLEKKKAQETARKKAAKSFLSLLNPSIESDADTHLDLYRHQRKVRTTEKTYGLADDFELSQIHDDALLPSYTDELFGQPERPNSPRRRAGIAAFDAAVKENQKWRVIEEQCAPLMIHSASQEFGKLYKDPHEAYSEAYYSAQSEIAHETALKLLGGKSVTSYELRVRDENAVVLNRQIPKVIGYAYGGACIVASIPASIYPPAGMALGGIGSGIIHQAAHDYALPKTNSEWTSLGLSIASGAIGSSTKPVVWLLGGSTISGVAAFADSPDHMWEGVALGAFGAFDKGVKLYNARKTFTAIHSTSTLSYETVFSTKDFWRTQNTTAALTYQGNRVIQQMELAAAGEVQSAFPLINVTKPSILTGVKKADVYSHDFLSVRVLGESNLHTANTNLPKFANLNRPFVPYAEDLRATGTFGRTDDGMLLHVGKMEGKTISSASFTQDVPVVFMQAGKGGGKGNVTGVGSVSSDVPVISGSGDLPVPAFKQAGEFVSTIPSSSHVQTEIDALRHLKGSVQSGQEAIRLLVDRFNKSAYQHNKIEDLLIKRYGKENVESHYKIHDFSLKYEKEKRNFISVPKEFEGTFSRPLVVVNFHENVVPGAGRSLMWWAPIHETNNLNTVQEVMDYFALLSNWGKRSHVSIAIIPAGERVKFLHGRAKLQKKEMLIDGRIKIIEFRKGGGIQYAFETFDANWVEHKCSFNEFIEIVRELYL